MSKVFEYYNSRKRIPITHELESLYEPTKLDYLDVSFSSRSIYFTFDGVLTEDEAFELQKEYGKHPHGYGFYGFKVDGGVSIWNCSRSCD